MTSGLKLYEKYYHSNYEELLTYYPRFYRDVLEMVEILKAQGRIADRLEADIEQTFWNNFIDYADEATIGRLEVFLKIGLNTSWALEERRQIVKSYFIGAGRISASVLAQMLQSIVGCPEPDIRLEPIDAAGNNGLLIDFDCSENAAQKLAIVKEVLAKKVPAHIPLLVTAISRFVTELHNPENIRLVTVRLPFFFSNMPNEVTLLNGRRTLDGSWLLDSTFRGVTFASFNIQLNLPEPGNAMAVGFLLMPEMRLVNQNRSLWPGVTFASRMLNQNAGGSKSLGLESRFVSGQLEAQGGSLTRDTMWRLDGGMSLDGSKKLNAAITTEEL